MDQRNQVRRPEPGAPTGQLDDRIGRSNTGPRSWNAYEFPLSVPVVGTLLSPVQAAVGELVFTAEQRVEGMGDAENRRSILRPRGIC